MSNIPNIAAHRPASTTNTVGDRPAGLRRILILALGTFAVGTDAFILAGFLPNLAMSLQVSTAAAGYAVTVFAAAYALLSPVVATLTARLPRRALLVTALVILGVANLASAAAPNLAVLLVTRVLAAAGAAAFTPNAGAVAATLVRPEIRARALAVVIGGLTVATALGVPLGDLAGEWFGWRMALVGVAALCVIAAAGTAASLPALPGSASVPLSKRLSVLRDRSVAAVLPLTVLGMGASYVVYAYSVPALAALGIETSSTAWLLLLYGVGAIAGNLYSGYATDRWGPVRILTLAYAVMSATLALMAVCAATHTTLLPATALLCLTWGASTWSQTPAQQHRLIAAAPAESGLVVALNASATYLGIGAGTILGGLTVAHPASMFAVAAALATLALTYLRLLR
ncbi:MFS transporter [Nocardia inohanensis]|uniref:MFS transporter n=1 Tax=Nocardia inohanensis TaxID=209246 RepID=UPI0008298E6B|nr:MFS transporter [Nocardia inohanensis]